MASRSAPGLLGLTRWKAPADETEEWRGIRPISMPTARFRRFRYEIRFDGWNHVIS
jgi:hypothetical protein